MIQDATNQYISTILSHCSLTGRDVLEIGCGKGRITRDLARHAGRVVASDPDPALLDAARKNVADDRVEFRHAPQGIPAFPPASFDVVIYTLSLHHVPLEEMPASLTRAAGMLREDGAIVVVEPGDGGSFTEAKERFGAGSGDERPARAAAICAMQNLEGWQMEETTLFRVQMHFDSEDDFFVTMLPDCRRQSESFLNEVRDFLHKHRTAGGIILDAGRRLDVLRRVDEISKNQTKERELK